MKKIIILLVGVFFVLSFSKASMGQKTPDMAITFFDIRYEYHPYQYNIDYGKFDFGNIHTGKLGVLGVCFFLGKNQGCSLEYKLISFALSTSKEEPFGVSFLNFVFRVDKGRFNPCVNLNLVEFTRNKVINKNVIRHSISGGFELYLSKRSILALNIGLLFENDKRVDSYLSPFVGIGFKIDSNLEK